MFRRDIIATTGFAASVFSLLFEVPDRLCTSARIYLLGNQPGILQIESLLHGLQSRACGPPCLTIQTEIKKEFFFPSQLKMRSNYLVSTWNLSQLYSPLIDIQRFVRQHHQPFSAQFVEGHLNQNSNFSILASRRSVFVFLLHLLIPDPPQSMYMYPCPAGVSVCHPIRAQSDLAKRLHRTAGLLWSRHWDASRLGDCLRSFSQQLTPSATTRTETPSCLVFDCRNWWTQGWGWGWEGSKEWKDAQQLKIQVQQLKTDNKALCLVEKTTHSSTIDGEFSKDTKDAHGCRHSSVTLGTTDEDFDSMLISVPTVAKHVTFTGLTWP